MRHRTAFTFFLQTNFCSQTGLWPRRHCLVSSLHKILVFLMRSSFSLSCYHHCYTDGGQRGWTDCGLRATEGCPLTQVPSFCQADLRRELLGHPRFSSTDMELETGQKMEIYCDFLSLLLLCLPNSSLALVSGTQMRLKERGGVCWSLSSSSYPYSPSATAIVPWNICFQVT